MCNCRDDIIQRNDVERVIWTIFGDKQMNGWKHLKCGKRLSTYQVMYKLRKLTE